MWQFGNAAVWQLRDLYLIATLPYFQIIKLQKVQLAAM
jgi:hypothetical protein